MLKTKESVTVVIASLICSNIKMGKLLIGLDTTLSTIYNWISGKSWPRGANLNNLMQMANINDIHTNESAIKRIEENPHMLVGRAFGNDIEKAIEVLKNNA